MRGIHIYTNVLRDVLKEELGRRPTPEEVKSWKRYVEDDVSQWLTDNIRAFRDTDEFRLMADGK